jgi:hypothetical protein
VGLAITEGREQLVDLSQLAPELRRGQTDARFVVHEVVRQFVAIGDDASHEVGMALCRASIRKKVARALWERRTRSSSGVVVRWGPSSMVSAT